MNSVTKLIGLVLLCLGSAVFAAPAYQPADYYSETHCIPKSHVEHNYWSQKPYVGIPYDRRMRLLPYETFMARLEDALGRYIDDRSRYVVQEGLDGTIHFNELKSYAYINRDKNFVYMASYATSDTTSYPPHTLTDHDKMVMLELIDIFVQDKQKSNELLDELYKRYLGQVELIVDGDIVVFLEYQGKYFSLHGGNLNYHPVKKCNHQYIYSLSIE